MYSDVEEAYASKQKCINSHRVQVEGRSDVSDCCSRAVLQYLCVLVHPLPEKQISVLSQGDVSLIQGGCEQLKTLFPPL